MKISMNAFPSDLHELSLTTMFENLESLIVGIHIKEDLDIIPRNQAVVSRNLLEGGQHGAMINKITSSLKGDSLISAVKFMENCT